MKGALANLPVETFQAASDLVLRGPPITMPNVVGQDPVVATPTLTALGLVVTPIAGATQVVSIQPQGKIDSTVPAAGTIVYAGQTVKLLISSGVPPPTPTPTDIPPASLPPGVTPSDSASPSASASATGTPSPTATPTH
jgi:beta-lactam-binding protein with PASTA domain